MLEFIDNTGNIFTVDSYTSYPIGYEYEQAEPIFWFKSPYSESLSIDNWYVQPIRFIIPTSETVTNIEIQLESETYKLYKGIMKDNIEIEEDSLVPTIESISDISVIENVIDEMNNPYNLYTVYAFCKSGEEATIISQMMIHIIYQASEEWCPISLGATFEDKNECLYINGSNFGFRMPKDIIKAVWGTNYINDSTDLRLYNIKLKEWLLNHNNIKSTCGNYQSALNSLKWFGWGDYIKISKLLKTDNEFFNQYIHDYFDTNEDINETYRRFKISNYISLYISANAENGYTDIVDDTESLWGEGNPILEDLIYKIKETDKDGLKFRTTYYEYSFNELAYKLACLADMYKKYFLPIHLFIHSASIRHKVYSNSLKMLNKSSLSVNESNVFTSDSNYSTYSDVKFSDKSVYKILTYDGTFTDKSFCEYGYFTEELCSSDSKYIYTDNMPIVKIPIYFNTYIKDMYDENGCRIKTEGIYNCSLVLHKDDKSIYETSFVFCDNEKFENFVIIPKMLQIMNTKDFWYTGTFVLDVMCNGNWYRHNFQIQLPEFRTDFGRLVYKYDYNAQRQISEITDTNIQFNADIIKGKINSLNNINFNEEIKSIIDSDTDGHKLIRYIDDFDSYIRMNDKRYLYNKIAVYSIYNKDFNELVYDDYTAFSDDRKELYDLKPETIELYRKFFNDDGTEKDNGHNFNSDLFDFYLMHDKHHYYCVFISKVTTDQLDDIDIPSVIQFDEYTFEKIKDNDIFLINRMDIEYSNGRNIFSKDDIIVSEISSFDIPLINSVAYKWTYNYISCGNKLCTETTSNTEIGVMPIPENETTYIPGFYNVTVSFSLDGYYDSKIVTSKLQILR